MGRYSDPILQKIVKLMNEHGPRELEKRWGVGDPIVVSAGSLPRAFIQYDNAVFSDASNAETNTDSAIVINVVVDMKKEFGSPKNKVESHEQVVDMIQRRGDDVKISAESIVGCLLKYQDDLGDKCWVNIGNPIETDYGIGIEKRGPGIMTAEGLVRFTVTHQQISPFYYEKK